MPDFSKEQSKKIQVGSKEGIITIFKAQFIEDPLLRNSGRPSLCAFRILANR
jgi:hypothetical protein